MCFIRIRIFSTCAFTIQFHSPWIDLNFVEVSCSSTVLARPWGLIMVGVRLVGKTGTFIKCLCWNDIRSICPTQGKSPPSNHDGPHREHVSINKMVLPILQSSSVCQYLNWWFMIDMLKLFQLWFSVVFQKSFTFQHIAGSDRSTNFTVKNNDSFGQ